MFQAMNRKTLLLALPASILITLASCDVRKTDQHDHSAGAAAPVEALAPTSVQVIDSVYDFGSIREGELVEYSFRFKNTGSEPLVVNNVSASCGCTVGDKPQAPVKPGELGFIKVKFNSANRPGEAHKSVTVSSNASPAFPELIMKGTVLGKEQ